MKRYKQDEERLFQSLMVAQEDLPPGAWARYTAESYRWFRSPNIVCLEHYRPAPAVTRRKPAA